MSAVAAFLLSPIGRGLGLALILLTLLAGLYACGRRDGREAARTESLNRTVKAVETRRDVEDSVAREPDPADRLRTDGWTRD